MSRFLKRILGFSIAFFILEKVFWLPLIISPHLEVDKRLEETINGFRTEKLIVLGSSRGARDIIASQIRDSIDISSYNLSYPGSNIEFHEFLLRAIIDNNQKPRFILLVIDDTDELIMKKSLRFRLDRLYPLVKYNFIINEMIARKEKNATSMLLALSRINRKNFDLRSKKFTPLDTIMSCGSMPISFQNSNAEFIYSNKRPAYPKKDELPEKLRSFINIQNLCYENEIDLILLYPPNYKVPNNCFEDRIKQISLDSTIHYHYDKNDSRYKDKSYYYDENHLNSKGAEVFTNEVISFLTSELIVN